MFKSLLANIYSKINKFKLFSPILKLKPRKLLNSFWGFTVDYFLGLIVFPWLWILGFWIFYSFFIYLYIHSSTQNLINELVLSRYFYGEVRFYIFWLVSSSFLLLNYTIYFFLLKKRSKIAIFISFLSFFICFLMLLFGWPFFQETLRNG